MSQTTQPTVPVYIYIYVHVHVHVHIRMRIRTMLRFGFEELGEDSPFRAQLHDSSHVSNA